ncbi:anti-sigma factor [Candidatus Uhrbacteria bacterium]|nr:anti-sigma factor [Candidatus Uhrbacteria bacterium]
MKKAFCILFFTLALFGFGCANKIDTVKDENAPKEINREQILTQAKRDGLIMDDNEIEKMSDVSVLQTTNGKNQTSFAQYIKKDFAGWNSAALADVTSGGSFGLAFSTFETGSYTLVVKMGNLPELSEGSHYEGWVVKRGNEMRVISVGQAIKNEDQFVIVFKSPEDLTAYDFFVLTLESNETDPSPSSHILEGTFR